jgi:hypothetical protein
VMVSEEKGRLCSGAHMRAGNAKPGKQAAVLGFNHVCMQVSVRCRRVCMQKVQASHQNSDKCTACSGIHVVSRQRMCGRTCRGTTSLHSCIPQISSYLITVGAHKLDKQVLRWTAVRQRGVRLNLASRQEMHDAVWTKGKELPSSLPASFKILVKCACQ